MMFPSRADDEQVDLRIAERAVSISRRFKLASPCGGALPAMMLKPVSTMIVSRTSQVSV